MVPRFLRAMVSRENYASESHPLARRIRKITPSERREEARAFLRDFYAVYAADGPTFERRWADVRRSLSRRDYYEHTPEELAYGARIAWRNHGRCIGRLFWESLEVVDCREVVAPDAMAESVAQHMRDAFGNRRIRSLITVFAPIKGNTMPAYIESGQITQYAGYGLANGSVLGDRQNIEATRIALAGGWSPDGGRTRFDLLPWFLRDANDRRVMFNLPRDAFHEVHIRHPDSPAIGDLGLRWYAVPCVSGMILTIGGIDYPCAPFNGFYMGTEIASRDFADRNRYDLLPQVARALGLTPDRSADPLWEDTALTELNRAVLHSFRDDGVTILDHHRASDQFMEFLDREQSQGRQVAADWRWILPPQASSACPVFHLKMKNFHPVPNYYRSWSEEGWRLMPFYGDKYRSRWDSNIDRIRRRLKLWKRQPW